MICKKHEQLNLIYFVGDDQPVVEYLLNIPGKSDGSKPPDKKPDVSNFTTLTDSAYSFINTQ